MEHQGLESPFCIANPAQADRFGKPRRQPILDGAIFEEEQRDLAGLDQSFDVSLDGAPLDAMFRPKRLNVGQLTAVSLGSEKFILSKFSRGIGSLWPGHYSKKRVQHI